MAADISKITEIAGFIGACLVDADTGLMLISYGGGGTDLEAVAALNAEVLKAERQALVSMGFEDDIKDMTVMLGRNIQMIHLLPDNPSLFLYVAVSRDATNLGMLRLQVREILVGLEL